MNKYDIVKAYVDYNNKDIGEGEKKMTLAEGERRFDKVCGFIGEVFKEGKEIRLHGYLRLYTKILKGRTYKTGKEGTIHVVGDRLVPRCEFGTIINDIVRNL